MTYHLLTLRRIACVFCFCVVWLALAGTAHAADQVVTSNADSGAGSLRQAISDAGDGDTITFNLSSGNETITISSELSLEFSPAKSVTINGDNSAGSGTNVTVRVSTTGAGGSAYRVFKVNPGSDKQVIFKNMTLKGGDVSEEGASDRDGGVIKFSQGEGTLTLDNVTIDGGEAARGGCIYAVDFNEIMTLNIYNSTLKNCRADGTWTSGAGRGGGLDLREMRVNIATSTISNNTSKGASSNVADGAGVFANGGTTTVENTTVANNTNELGSGGGFYIDGDNTFTLKNSTVHGNSVTGNFQNFGGIYFSSSGTGTITNSTIFNNDASFVGGGLHASDGTLILTNTTIAHNSAGDSGDGLNLTGATLYIKNSLLANNNSSDFEYSSGTVNDNGYNIVENSSGYTFSGTGDITGEQSGLHLSGSLADNSTLNNTQTLALTNPASVAINAGDGAANNDVSIPTTDQRGLSRVGTVDIGAYEDQTDTVAPTLSLISASSKIDGATIAWSTDEAASSKVNFGLTSSYGTSTPETNTSPRVTSHSVDLTGLVSCAQYHYQTQSIDGSSNTATSTDNTFTTSGCNGSAPISSTGQQDSVATSSSSTASHSDVTLTIPAGYSSSTVATFQINELDGTTFFNNVSAPSGLSRAGTHAYNLKALTDATTTLTSFDSAITITLSYTDSDVSDLDESSLKIHRYDGSSWSELSNCSVDTGANTVSCDTTQFSEFSIFGEQPTSNNTSSGPGISGGGYLSDSDVQDDEDDTETDTTHAEHIAALKAQIDDLKEQIARITVGQAQTAPDCALDRDLEIGMTGADVKCLQQYLNINGFELANTGPGSPGNETSYFGSRTKNALMRYQEANADVILTPIGLTNGTGYFGPSTQVHITSSS